MAVYLLQGTDLVFSILGERCEDARSLVKGGVVAEVGVQPILRRSGRE